MILLYLYRFTVWQIKITKPAIFGFWKVWTP